jgi:hypothetical protein
MPYIKQGKRFAIDQAVYALRTKLSEGGFDKGSMNYAITKLIQAYIRFHGKTYNSLSDVTGVLNDVKVEFERRVVAPYENEKIDENGDVYLTWDKGTE